MGPYLYPHLGGIDLKLFRVAGPGLGNSLFPWARSISDAYKFKLPFVEPPWLNLKPGAWLRGERDKRTYIGLFKSQGIMKHAARILLSTFLPKVSETQINSIIQQKRRCVVVYSGLSGLFSPIIHDYELIKNEIEKRARNINVDLSNKIPDKFIAVHVRLGDFSASSPVGPKSGQNNTRLPMLWYKEKVCMLQKYFPGIPVLIFSDGSENELNPLLTLRNCYRAPENSALIDILTIAKAGAFIASGSTFSMWASYLGRMPVIWFPGQLRQKLYLNTHGCEIESGIDETVPENFRTMVEQRWKN